MHSFRLDKYNSLCSTRSMPLKPLNRLKYTVQSHHIAWQALKVIIGRFQGVGVHIENYNVIQSQPANSLQSEEHEQ